MTTLPPYTVRKAQFGRLWDWRCNILVRATAIVGDTSTRPCRAHGSTGTEAGATTAAEAHLATHVEAA